MRITASVVFLMLIFAVAPLSAQEDLPPPLGFSIYSEDHLRYYIYDFETEQITTIASARPEGQGVTYDWGDPPPDELFLQSPYDPAVRLVLVSTTPEQDANEGPIVRALYRVQPDGTRQFITETIYTPFYSDSVVYSTTEWSPDGRYYYVFSGLDFFKGYALYRLDLETNQMTLLLDKASGIDTCQPDGVWCTVYTYEERVNHKDETPPKTLHLIDRNTGQLWELGTSATSYVSLYWASDGSAFFYAMALDQKSYALHHYNLATHADQLLSEWKGIRLYLYESLVERWLMISPTVRAGRGYNTGLYTLDMTDYTAEAFMLGENIASISQAHEVDSSRWLDDETFVYRNRSRDGSAIYRAHLPTREIRELTTLAAGGEYFDHDWSPDGKWLALSTQPSRNAPPHMYLVSMEGEVREVKLPDMPQDAQVCIGWFSQEVYEGGNADLCNFVTHIG